MKREGKQHGMVRSVAAVPSYPDSKAKAAAPAAGAFARAPNKPTNHSKYTARCRKGKCRDCHAAPVSKSRDKAKGASKLRSCDVLLNHRLVSWRVVVGGGGGEGRGLAGCEAFSATEMLDRLCAASGRSLHEGEEGEEQRGVEEEGEEGSGGRDDERGFAESTVDLMEAEEEEEEEEEEFLVVGVSWEAEEDWLVVGEM